MPPEGANLITSLIEETTYQESTMMDEQEALDSGILQIIGKEVDDAYIEFVHTLCVNPDLAREMGKTIKLVYTPLHGSGNIPVRRILKEIGFENVYVVKEQELPNGDFPTVKVPNPEEASAFDMALALQKEVGADLCFGTDPDCDRVGIACLNKKGELKMMNGNQIGCLLLHYILSQRKEKGTLPANAAAVKSIVSTEMARTIAADYGCEMIDVLTGFKFIAEQIEKFSTTGSNTFMFGFEESFGFLSGTEVRDKDGVNACMLIAEAAAWYKKQDMTLAEGLDMLYEKYGHYGEKVQSFVLSGKDGLEKMQVIMKTLRENPPKDFAGIKITAVRDYQTSVRTLADGTTEPIALPKSNVLYYEMEGGAWICVRPSGTEPKIKLYVNAVSDCPCKTQQILNDSAAAAVALLESI